MQRRHHHGRPEHRHTLRFHHHQEWWYPPPPPPPPHWYRFDHHQHYNHPLYNSPPWKYSQRHSHHNTTTTPLRHDRDICINWGSRSPFTNVASWHSHHSIRPCCCIILYHPTIRNREDVWIYSMRLLKPISTLMMMMTIIIIPYRMMMKVAHVRMWIVTWMIRTGRIDLRLYGKTWMPLIQQVLAQQQLPPIRLHPRSNAWNWRHDRNRMPYNGSERWNGHNSPYWHKHGSKHNTPNYNPNGNKSRRCNNNCRNTNTWNKSEMKRHRMRYCINNNCNNWMIVLDYWHDRCVHHHLPQQWRWMMLMMQMKQRWTTLRIQQPSVLRIRAISTPTLSNRTYIKCQEIILPHCIRWSSNYKHRSVPSLRKRRRRDRRSPHWMHNCKRRIIDRDKWNNMYVKFGKKIVPCGNQWNKSNKRNGFWYGKSNCYDGMAPQQQRQHGTFQVMWRAQRL